MQSTPTLHAALINPANKITGLFTDRYEVTPLLAPNVALTVVLETQEQVEELSPTKLNTLEHTKLVAVMPAWFVLESKLMENEPPLSAN